MYFETNNLTKKYNNKIAVNNVSIHVSEGCIYGLIGKNGAGKTTLMKMLSGLVIPTSGTISNIDKLRNVGVLIEAPGLYLNRTCFDNLKFKMMLSGTYNEMECLRLLKMVGLKDDVRTKASKLSLGMKQRLGLALALASQSKLLILDEPMNGLDPDGMMDLRDILVSLKEKGMTILISSHLLSELDKIADTFGFMHEGKLVKEMNRDDSDESLEEIYLQITRGPKS